MTKPELLLHTCCAPCATVPLERLHDMFDLTGFFYNPNITPGDEYRLRLTNLQAYCHLKDVRLLEGEYDVQSFLQNVLRADDGDNWQEGGERCERCYAFRLDRTAKEAKSRGFPWFGTTLTISPYKNTEIIHAIGHSLGEKYGLRFLAEDHKLDNGYQRSIELSKDAGLYRQNYCGCRPRSKVLSTVKAATAAQVGKPA